MTKKCDCKNCSVHIEFEEENAGRTITCPGCGKETVLYIPKPKEAPKSAAAPEKNSFQESAPYMGELAQVRATSCYKALRTIINFSFNITKGVVALCGVLAIVGVFLAALPSIQASPNLLLVFRMLAALALSCFVILIVALIHAAHQAAVLLVDIADCNIRLVRASQTRPAEVTVTLPPARVQF